MKAAVLAAGRGERLRADGIATPKPLLPVAGQPLLGHALRALRRVGADDVLVVVNERDADAVATALPALAEGLPVRLLRRTTASSLETFAVAAEALAGTPHALVAMVDGVFGAEGLGRFAARARALDAGARPAGAPALDGLVGVTARPDDDAPLRVATDERGRVLAIGPDAEAWSPGPALATAGLYLLPDRALAAAPRALAEGVPALRGLLSRLVPSGLALEAVDLGTVVDVDRADDLPDAERLGGGG